MKKISLYLLTAVLVTACTEEKISEKKITSPGNAQEAVIPVKSSNLTPIERGAKIYKRCRACHTLDEGGRHKVGPNLWDVYGAQSASKEGFAYSKAMKAANIVWDEETMDGYLEKPSKYMPGNKMTFIGLKKQEDRDAVQAFMKSKTTP